MDPNATFCEDEDEGKKKNSITGENAKSLIQIRGENDL